jgi:uncharacterized protein (TIGR03085 family)
MMKDMTHLAQLERQAICDTLVAVGPDAPTVCSPWRSADLAAHLVVRERRPDLSAGIWIPPLASLTDRAIASYAAKPWPELVDLVRTGPPVWVPTRIAAVDDMVNFLEFTIHHEDVLRGDETPGPRRELSGRQSAAIWKSLTRLAKLYFRRVPVGVVLETPDGRTFTARTGTQLGTVVLRGAPLELLLTASGRRRVAELEVVGSEQAAAALWSASLGLS